MIWIHNAKVYEPTLSLWRGLYIVFKVEMEKKKAYFWDWEVQIEDKGYCSKKWTGAPIILIRQVPCKHCYFVGHLFIAESFFKSYRIPAKWKCHREEESGKVESF